MLPALPDVRVRRLACLSTSVVAAVLVCAAAPPWGGAAIRAAASLAPVQPHGRAAQRAADQDRDQDPPPRPPDVLEPGQACVDCHLDLTRGPVVHPPAEEEMCEDCHQPVAPPRHAFVAIPAGGRLCGLCHEVAPDAAVLHGPFALGSCGACHDPHVSDHPSLLTRGGPESCISCHQDMAALMHAPAEAHPELDQDCARCHPGPFSPPKRRVHGALGTERGCLNCHDPHGSALPGLLDAPTADLCLSCHRSELRREDGTTVVALGAKLSDSAALHGPLREGDCAACHDPHGSAHQPLLRAPYPRTFYAAFSVERYALCFGCHDPAAFLAPESAGATGFRDGTRNLHAVHVSGARLEGKGRTCGACHEVHASDLPHHLRVSVPFGAWRLPLGYRELPGGGSCAPGCHLPQSYSRSPESPGF